MTMRYVSSRSLCASIVACAAFVALAGAAQSDPVAIDLLDPTIPDNLAIYMKQFPDVSFTEQKIFLQSATDTNTVLGNVGSQTGTPIVHFDSAPASPLDVTEITHTGDGFANIKFAPHSGDTLNNLTVTVPGYSFGDLLFDVQLANVNNLSLEIKALNGTTVLGDLADGFDGSEGAARCRYEFSAVS